MQTNDYYWVEIVTWNNLIVYRLLVLDRNTWNNKAVCQLFVLDRCTWYHINVYKQMIIIK